MFGLRQIIPKLYSKNKKPKSYSKNKKPNPESPKTRIKQKGLPYNV